MKNQKGFTLVEILVALVIIAILIFSFTPLTVFSFKQIYESGRAQSQLYEQKGKVENTLAERNTNTGLPQVTIDTIFKGTAEGGHSIPQVGPIPVVGSWVSDSGSQSNFEIATVYTAIGSGDNHARIRLTPDSVSEDDDLSDKVIYIYSEFLMFDHTTQFRLRDNTNTPVTGVSFSYINDTTFSLALNDSITAGKSPYTVEMVDSIHAAKLYVDPPNILVACSDGQYYTSSGIETDEDGKAYAVFSKSANIIANSINDIIWHQQAGKYIAVGNNGVYRTLAGGGSWDNLDIGESDIYSLVIIIELAKNSTPDIKVISTDSGGLPVIGGTFDYMERGLFRWSRELHGFLTLRESDDYIYLEHDDVYITVNDILTVQDNDGVFTVGVGRDKNNRGYVMARRLGENNNNWFETFDRAIGLPEMTAIDGGIDVNGMGTPETGDDSASPIFVVTTADGKIYSTNAIVRGTTSWQEMTVPSGGPSSFSSVTCGGDRFVAVGNSNKALVRRNGPNMDKTWTAETICTGSAAFSDVVYINDRFFAVGSSGGTGVIYFSTDGENWTEADFIGAEPNEAFVTIAGRN